MHRTLLSAALFAAIAFSVSSAQAATFTYHGNLQDSGKPADGTYDLELTLYSSPEGGKVVAGPLVMYKVPIHEGTFSTEADFGLLTHVSGPSWLGVAVRNAGKGDFAALSARAPISAAETATNSSCPGSWSLDGNAGNPAGDYLGTADSQPLIIKVGSSQVANALLSSGGIVASWIGGGSLNTSTGTDGSFIGGGGSSTDSLQANSAGSYCVVGGGAGNKAGGGSSSYATVAGGTGNIASGASSTAGGGARNEVNGDYSVISGGADNSAFGLYLSVGGGDNNYVGADYSVIGGGFNNANIGSYALVGGGSANVITGSYSVIGGGADNSSPGSSAVIAGGISNQTSCAFSTVSGGTHNLALGCGATIPGGQYNLAGAQDSFAAGTNAGVRIAGAVPATIPPDLFASDYTGSAAVVDDGTFVWADYAVYPGYGRFTSTGPNQFDIRANGGVGINAPPSDPNVELTITSNETGPDYANIWLRPRNANKNGIVFTAGDGSGTNNAGFYIENYNGSAQSRRMQLANDGSAYIRSNTSGANTGVTLPANGGAWSSLSDRNVKTAIAAIDPVAILQRLVRMPVSEWSYTAQGPGIRHMGPMAQDFSAAFSIGEDNTHISTIDADGVAFAAIKGLNQKLESENAALKKEKDAEVSALQTKLDEVLARLSKLESQQGE